MSHRIQSSRFAHRSQASKALLSSVQLYDPRKGTLRGHLITVAVCFLIALAVFGVERAAG